MEEGTRSVLAGEFLRELEAEVRATRECLAAVPMGDPGWKPHEKSMELGYMAQLVADMPRWVTYAIEKGEVDFETYPVFDGKTTEQIVGHFDECVDGARGALRALTDEGLEKKFRLKRGEAVLMEQNVRELISSTINHMVHHRGQLTVYLRMLDKKVPSIYGPSADSGGFDTL